MRSTMIEAPPNAKQHRMVLPLFDDQITAIVMGRPHNWSAGQVFPGHPERVFRTISETTGEKPPKKLFALRDEANNGFVVDPSNKISSGAVAQWNRQQIFYSLDADGLLLPPSSCGYVATNGDNGDLILAMLNLTTGSLGVIRASLPLLVRYPKGDPRCAKERSSESILTTLLSAFLGQRPAPRWRHVFRAWIFGGVRQSHLTLRTDDPALGKHNSEIHKRISAQWGTGCLSEKDPQGNVGVSVPNLIATQLDDPPWRTRSVVGAPEMAGVCFCAGQRSGQPSPWHCSLCGDKGMNGVIVVNQLNRRR